MSCQVCWCDSTWRHSMLICQQQWTDFSLWVADSTGHIYSFWNLYLQWMLWIRNLVLWGSQPSWAFLITQIVLCANGLNNRFYSCYFTRACFCQMPQVEIAMISFEIVEDMWICTRNMLSEAWAPLSAQPNVMALPLPWMISKLESDLCKFIKDILLWSLYSSYVLYN